MSSKTPKYIRERREKTKKIKESEIRKPAKRWLAGFSVGWKLFEGLFASLGALTRMATTRSTNSIIAAPGRLVRLSSRVMKSRLTLTAEAHPAEPSLRRLRQTTWFSTQLPELSFRFTKQLLGMHKTTCNSARRPTTIRPR